MPRALTLLLGCALCLAAQEPPNTESAPSARPVAQTTANPAQKPAGPKAPSVSILPSGSFSLWPVPNANLDLDLRKTVAEEYPNRQAFLNSVDSQLHRALSPYRVGTKPTPEELRDFLSTPEGEPLKDLAKLITQAQTEAQAKGAPIDLTAISERLAGLPVLKDFTYLIIPYGLTGGRGIASGGGSTWMARASTGPGSASGPQGTWMPTSSGAASTAFLRVYVVDLKERRLLLEGRIGASASSSFMKVTALHELEEHLGKNLLSALLNPS